MIIIVWLLLLLPTVEASGKDASPFDQSDDSRPSLYIEIMSAYAPLSKCMSSYFDADLAAQKALFDKALTLTDAASFDHDASSVMGSEHPALVAVRKNAHSDADRVKAILLALGVFAMLDSDKSLRARTYRGSAVVLGMITLAKATDGQCAPSNALGYWMEQVPHADQKNPRP